MVSELAGGGEMKRQWVKKMVSFREAEKFDKEYYLAMSPAERLDIVQFLREVYRKFGRGKNEERKGLRGFIGISDLIKSKAAANRKQDSADLDILRAAQHKRVANQ